MAKAAMKARANPAAQSREEAETLIARMGDLQRERARRQADYGDKAASLKAEAESVVQPLDVEIEDIRTRVQGWCEANRNTITQGGKVKFAAFATGEVKWRALPPKVTIRGAEKVIEAARRLGLVRFIRTKEEPNKEAMLAEPELAATLDGVSIGSAGEEFAVEPFQPEIVGVAA
jgi:phage host-nuclease inhibitor protein Gam